MDDITKMFLELYNLYSNDVFRLAFNYTRNINEAEDITQIVFIKLFKEIKKDNNKSYGKKWLLTVTSNECKNNFKLAWKRKVVLQDEFEQNITNLNDALRNDKLTEALLKLSSKYRTVIYLYYYEGYKIDDICEILNFKQSNIKILLSRGRKKLKEYMEEMEDEK